MFEVCHFTMTIKLLKSSPNLRYFKNQIVPIKINHSNLIHLNYKLPCLVEWQTINAVKLQCFYSIMNDT